MEPTNTNFIPQLPKDVYLKIAEEADDRAILNMLRVNRKYYNEEYFLQLFRKRYPLLMGFKDSQSWKDFYIRMTHYLSLLKEEFSINYIADPMFNPEHVYKMLQTGDTNLKFWFAGRTGQDLDLTAANRGEKAFYFRGLAETGRLELFQKKNGVLNNPLAYAVLSGDPAMISFAEKTNLVEGNPGYREVIQAAASIGRKDLVEKYMKICIAGGCNPDAASAAAARGFMEAKDLESLKLYLDLPYWWNVRLFLHAARYGNVEILKYLYDLYSNGINSDRLLEKIKEQLKIVVGKDNNDFIRSVFK